MKKTELFFENLKKHFFGETKKAEHLQYENKNHFHGSFTKCAPRTTGRGAVLGLRMQIGRAHV